MVDRMSIHGICYDNGQSGNCNVECELFRSGECQAADEVYCAFEHNLSDEDKEIITELYGDLACG